MDSSSDASSLCSRVEAEEDQGWLAVNPAMGQIEYVMGLQRLGIHMAKSIPSKVKSHVIKPLGVDPTRDLFIGRLNAQTKERTLKLNSTMYYLFCFAQWVCMDKIWVSKKGK